MLVSLGARHLLWPLRSAKTSTCLVSLQRQKQVTFVACRGGAPYMITDNDVQSGTASKFVGF